MPFVQGRKANHSKWLEASHRELEEVLRKSSSSDLESGVTMASEAINKHEIDAKLYLLRAKLSFKLVRRPNVNNIHIRYHVYFLSISLLSNNFMEK